MLDLLDEFSTLVRALEACGVEYAVGGGLALAAYGIPRATIDIDRLIAPDSLGAIEAIAHDLGTGPSLRRCRSRAASWRSAGSPRSIPGPATS